MKKSLLFTVLFSIVPLSAHALPDGLESKRKAVPDFPASCAASPEGADAQAFVDIAFTVGSNGNTKNVRVMQSSDPCFEEAAVAAVRGWEYERTSRSLPDEIDLETSFVFQLNDPTETDDIDASPVKRVPPQFPARCYEQFANDRASRIQDQGSDDVKVYWNLTYCPTGQQTM